MGVKTVTARSDIDADDLELLEAHLDGELTPAEAEAVLRRLSNEPTLAAQLERLGEERDLRRAAWTSLEPDAAHARATVSAAVAAAARAERARSAAAFAGRATAAAAVVLLAFAGGWMARGRVAPERPTIVVPASDGPYRDERPFITSGSGDGRPFPHPPRKESAAE